MGAAAGFNAPFGIAADSSNNLYVADSGNHTIRKITPAGLVSTLAGVAGSSGSSDGMGSAARFWDPTGLAIDGSGNLYVADTHNSTVRLITPAGMVSTLVGAPGQAGFTPGALPGRISFPRAVAINGSSLCIISNNGLAIVTKLP